MKEANPLSLVDELKTVLQRYIATTLPISRNYPKLAEKFRELLAQQTLVEGPYVEALPDFEKGLTLENLLKKNGGFIHDAMGKLPFADRKLHLHQQRAIELSVKNSKSLLVATGTGSGKTETFLYPIAHELLSDPAPDKPGVRALLVYPMNALANDQLYYRIAPMFGRHLKEYDITFGRYTGQVKANIKRGEEEAKIFNNSKLMHALGQPGEMPSNWLLTREEMLRNPPKVLITNYAMLEHLLLLPRNERLFSANALKFIVLDEIHSYHGAQATEVAFLLRKLKNRLGIDSPLQVFGTSASLAVGEEADEKLKEFATGLFGEEVKEVVRGKRIVHENLQTPVTKEFTLSAADWVLLGGVLEEILKLHEADRTAETWDVLIEGKNLRHPELKIPQNAKLTHFLEEQFSSNKEIRKISKLLDSGGITSFIDLAKLVFDSPVENSPPETHYAALSAAIRMGMLARKDEISFPLLPGRYHIAVNSIEGLAVLPSNDKEGWSKLKMARHHRGEDGFYYPVMTCRKCGQPYIEGFEVDSRLHNRRPDDQESRGERRVFWLGRPVGYVEDEDDEVEVTETAQYQKYNLDVKTGELVAKDESVILYAVQTVKDEEEKAWYVRKCPACGGIASGTDAEIITRMHPGNEALCSVVAQRVLESLPPGVIDNSDPKPALGRNLLTFSDNRQDAAFFAPYFERTSSEIALRCAIRNVLRDRDGAMTAVQLADQIYQFWQRDGQQPVLIDINGEIVSQRQDAIPIILGSLASEFCTPGGRRNSLEALGLVNVTYEEQKLRLLHQKVKSFWPAELPSDDLSIKSIIHILLESVRRERALSKFHNVPLSDEHVWGVYNQHRSFDIEAGDNNVLYRWLPNQQQTRHNRRTWYLVEQLGLSRELTFQFMRQFWDVLTRPPISFLDRHPPGFALNGDLIRFANGDSMPLYVCSSCGLMQKYSVRNKCVAYHCRGNLDEIGHEERGALHKRNHYMATYDESNHVTVRAREHTASLSTDLREGIERDFAERKVNLLSCTTTMEMGVDLGDLEAVINLNVPPGIANYQQRTGRAGRRAQAAPFCVTVARNTNFDQKAVRDFQNYLGSSPGAPFIHLNNPELFRRHQFSILLSHFLKSKITDQEINAPSLKHLFGDMFTNDALKAFNEYLLQWFEIPEGANAVEEAENLVNKLPDMYRDIGSQGGYLRNQFIAAIREFSAEVCERFARYTERMTESATLSEFKRASYWQRMREDYMGQFLVNQLSQRGLIPTYSFPVHSINLEVMTESRNNYQSNSDVVLSRDASQGIGEYAPGAEVVANGRIWESAGIAHYPKAFMPERWYAACPECFHVDVGDLPDEIIPVCGNCGASDGRRKRKFIEPHGFVTSYSNRRGRDPGSSRRRVKPADEAKLIAAPRDDLFDDTGLPFMLSALLKAKAAGENGLKGSLFIANRGSYGEGYHRCSKCNYSAPIKPSPKKKIAKNRQPAGATPESPTLRHQDPQTGLNCPNEKMPRIGLDFVHRFDTDVRIFRFISALPEPESTEVEPKRFHQRMARTISEAIRLAVSEMMNLYPGEIRAIFRLYGKSGRRFEVVIYDAVPGGAGYCARIGESGFSFAELMKKTTNRLNCEAGCESGCRVCLCDYGNQRYWDSFERKAALAWVNGLLDPSRTSSGSGNYVRWISPSLAGLDERVANFDELHLVSRNLVSPGSYSEDSLSQLLAWLQSGKKIQIYLLNKLEEKPKYESPLTVYRRLHPYVLEGKLKLFNLAEDSNLDIESIPQIFTSSTVNSPLLKIHYPPQALLDAIISSPADVGVVDMEIKSILDQLLAEATPLGNQVFQEGEKMRMWELPKGAQRNFEEIFSIAKNAHIKELVIRDPYCGAFNNQKKLSTFLEILLKLSGKIDFLRIRCKELQDRQGNVEFAMDVEKRLDALVDGIGFVGREIIVSPIKKGGKSFHDRELDIVIYSDDGCESTHRYFLTGGIDYLVDQYAETRIFYILI